MRMGGKRWGRRAETLWLWVLNGNGSAPGCVPAGKALPPRPPSSPAKWVAQAAARPFLVDGGERRGGSPEAGGEPCGWHPCGLTPVGGEE